MIRVKKVSNPTRDKQKRKTILIVITIVIALILLVILVAKGFIKEVGRSEMAGRPILYKTTSEFLDYFGLAKIDDLPKMGEFKEEVLDDEKDLYNSKYIDEENV